MGDKQIRQPALFLQLGKQVQHLRADGDIQRADRLVGDDEIRLHDQRPRNADALPLPAGKFVRKPAGKFGQQAHVGQRTVNLLPALHFTLASFTVIKSFRNNIIHLGALVQARHRILKDHLNPAGQLAVQFF